MIQSPEDIERLISEWGFLPFFAGEVPDFSIEEQTAEEYWSRTAALIESGNGKAQAKKTPKSPVATGYRITDRPHHWMNYITSL